MWTGAELLFSLYFRYYTQTKVGWLVGFMVFNATFNNFSVISEYPEKTTDLSQVADKLDHIMFISPI